MGDTRPMHVSVFDGETLIGHASLTDLDPPMGVAMGAFTPSEHYVQAAHANVIDGDYVGERSRHFFAFYQRHTARLKAAQSRSSTGRLWEKSNCTSWASFAPTTTLCSGIIPTSALWNED